MKREDKFRVSSFMFRLAKIAATRTQIEKMNLKLEVKLELETRCY